MDKLPFRARQVHPAIVVRVEPDGEQALRLVLVAVDIVALTSTGRVKDDTKARTTTKCLDSLTGTALSVKKLALGIDLRGLYTVKLQAFFTLFPTPLYYKYLFSQSTEYSLLFSANNLSARVGPLLS